MDTTLGTRIQQSDSSPEGQPAAKYLVFELANEEFAIHVLSVKEILGIQEITVVPQMPAHIKGVINLRGKVIPVVDLRVRFGLPELPSYTEHSAIIVVQAKRYGSTTNMGIVVDGVVEVLSLTRTDIQETPDFGEGAAVPYLVGMAKVKGKVKMLLDINQVLTGHELRDVQPVELQ